MGLRCERVIDKKTLGGIDMKAGGDLQPLGQSLFQVLPQIRYLGTVCWIGWVLLIYSGEYFVGVSDVHGYDTLCYAVSTFAISVVFFLFGIGKERGYAIIQNNHAIVAAAMLASTGTVIVFLGSLAGEYANIVAVLGNIFTGCGTGCLAMKFVAQFSEETPKNIFILSGITLASALILYSAVLTFPQLVGIVITISLPIFAALVSSIDYGLDLSARSQGDMALPHSFIRFTVAIFILALILSVTRGFYPNGLHVDEFNLSRGFVALALIAGCITISLIAAVVPRGFQYGKLGYLAIVFTVLVFTLVSLTGLGSFVTGVTFSVANGLLGMIAWALFASLSSTSGISPLRVFGLGFSAFMMGSTLGWPFGFFIDSLQLTGSLGIFSAVLLAVVLLVCFVLFPHSNLSTLGNAIVVEDDEDLYHYASEYEYATVSMPAKDVEEQDELPGDTVRPHWRIRIMRLAEEYELSSRETEVFILMAKGKNARTIADELCVSYNTARTHVRNIYTKLGIHSRPELDQLVEHEPADL